MGNLTKIGTTTTEKTSTPKSYSAGGGTLTKIVPPTTSNNGLMPGAASPATSTAVPSVEILKASYLTARKAEDDAWNAFNQYNNSTRFTQVDQNVLNSLNQKIMDTTKAREAAEAALKDADALAYNNAYSEAKYANAAGVEATGFGKGVMSIGKTITAAPGVIAETAKSAIKDEDIDMSSDAMRNMGEAMYLRNAATENSGTVGKFLGNTALSIGQNMVLLPMNAVVPGSSLVAMGAISAADKMYELGAQGTDAKEALVRGTVSGVIEGLTEKLPLDTLSAMIKSGGKGVVKNLLKQSGVEATEEGVSYFANWVADKLAKDPNAKWDWNEFIQNVSSGGLSGLFFGLGGSFIGGANSQTSENTENRPITLKTDVTPTSPLSEQKIAPSAVNGVEAANENTAKSGTNLVLPTSGVNAPNPQNNSSAFMPGSGLENTVDGYGPNTVGSAQAQFKYQEAPTQSVGDNLFTEQEMQENPELQNAHQVLTNAEGRAIAEQMLANEYDSEVERLKTDEWGAVEQVEGYQILSDLVDKARETGDYSEAVEWKKLFDRKGTEAGQALQARAQFTAKPEYIVTEAAETLDGDNVRRMSDEKKRTILDNVEKQANTYDSIQEGDTSSLIALIERNNEIRRTTGLFSKKTAKQMDWALNEVVKNYPETAEQFLRDVAVSQIRSISSDYQKLSPLEAVKNYRVMGMLSKASTVMRNLVSNNVFDPLESLSNNVGIIADGIMSAATGQRTTAVDSSWLSKAKRSGSLEGALKSYIQVGLDADVGESGSRYETGDTRTFKMTGNFLERLLSTWSKYENYALKTTDEFQKGGIAAETQRGIDKLQQSGKLAEGMLPGWAGETAKQRTFQNEGAIAEAMVGLRSAANKISVKDKQGGSIGVGDVMLPFARVPGNLVAQAANYSPLGIANGLREITSVMVEAKKGNYSAEAQAQAARNFGRGVTGTGLLAGFAALAAKGLIDVAGADDKDKEALEKAQGKTGTQWNLSATMRAFNGESTEWQDGDTLMSIGFLDPINSIMAAAALISDAYAEDEKLTVGEVANASFSSLVQSILDLPAMSSISDLIDAYTYAEGETAGEKAASAALDYAGSQASSFLLPNALKGVASGLDDTVRNQYKGETIGEGVVDSLKYGIPGLRETLPASLDPFGREKTQTGDDVLNMLNNNLLPGAITKYSETKVEGALEDVYSKTGATGIYPDKSAPNSFSSNNVTYTLDADQKAAYMQTAGETALSVMSELIDSDVFRKASAEDQAAYLSLANEYARAVAKQEVTNGKYELSSFAKNVQEAQENGLSAANYIMYYNSKSDFDANDNDSYSNAEIIASIESFGLTGNERTALYMISFPDWVESANKYSVDFDLYVDYRIATDGLTADKDKNGTSITGSLKTKVLDAINKLKVSSKEKDALYYAAGYAESTIKDAPWH